MRIFIVRQTYYIVSCNIVCPEDTMLNIDIVCLDIQYRICAISYVKTYDIVCQNIRYHMSTSLLYDIVCPCKDIVLTIGTPNFFDGKRPRRSTGQGLQLLPRHCYASWTLSTRYAHGQDGTNHHPPAHAMSYPYQRHRPPPTPPCSPFGRTASTIRPRSASTIRPRSASTIRVHDPSTIRVHDPSTIRPRSSTHHVYTTNHPPRHPTLRMAHSSRTTLSSNTLRAGPSGPPMHGFSSPDPTLHAPPASATEARAARGV